MSALFEEYKQISQSFIDFIAVYKMEIEKNASKDNANKFYVDRDYKRLEDLFTIKHRFDYLFQSFLLVESDTFETGRAAGKKEAIKQNRLLDNPYDFMKDSERDSYRELHILQVKELFPHLF